MGITQQIGDIAEELATRHLLALGFDILHRNWRSGRYELDIVARRGDTLHIVEVKSRTEGGYCSPEEAMTERKFEALQRGAEAYIEEFGIDSDVSFDLVAVVFRGEAHVLAGVATVVTAAMSSNAAEVVASNGIAAGASRAVVAAASAAAEATFDTVAAASTVANHDTTTSNTILQRYERNVEIVYYPNVVYPRW